MKEMEAKTENRYEYRKPQEKRKQMIAPDLFEFAYVQYLLPVYTMVAKYRKKAIKELDVLYEERDRQTESFILR